MMRGGNRHKIFLNWQGLAISYEMMITFIWAGLKTTLMALHMKEGKGLLNGI